MSRWTVSAVLVGLLVAVAAFAPIAVADDPPVTVPTSTTPTPLPDPAPPKAQPKPQPAPAPATRSTPPRSNPTPVVTPSRTYTPPAVSSHPATSRPAPTATRRQQAKKHAVHKAKHKRTVVKTRPKPKAAAVVAHPQQRAASGPRVAASQDRGWLRWLLLLVAATGLMAVSFVSLVGAARNPARVRAGARSLRRPSREQIREVVAERIERPLPVAAAAVALPAARRPAPPPPRPAPEPVVERQPEPVFVPPVEAQVEEAETQVLPEPTEEVCEILVWRGYAKARFYARLDLDETDEFAVAESPSFRFQGNGTPDDTEAARTAHRALVEKLLAKGWEPDGASGPWYAARFRRPLDRNLS